MLIVVFIFLSAGCSSKGRYESANEFMAEIESWKVKGMKQSEAMKVFEKHGFSCREQMCYKDVAALICKQKQKVEFIVDQNGQLSNVKVWELEDGQLPSACL